MDRPLDGIRVVEVAAHVFMLIAGAVLADWGADVIKIEHPEYGDPIRGLVTAGLVHKVDYMCEHANRGKRSIGLDLRDKASRPILERLIASADVFTTSFLPDVRARLAIDVDDIRALNPDIVYARGTGQGTRGPDADKPGFDGTSFWSRGGLGHSLTPVGSSDTLQATPAIGDTQSGMNMAGGIAAALFHRERTGIASVVDVSLLGSAIWALAPPLIASELFDREVLPVPRSETSNPLTIAYQTADGRYIKLSMFRGDRFWDEFCRLIGGDGLLVDPRFHDSAVRSENSAECVEALDRIFATRTLDEWRERLDRLSGAWAVVQTQEEVLNDPQVADNDYLHQLTDGEGNPFKLVANPVQFDGHAATVQRAPLIGQQTEEVLLELGFDWPAIVELKLNGTIT